MSDVARHVAEHFDDFPQQHHAAGLGMWMFLGTEVLFFGGLFLGYSLYRHDFEDAFRAAGEHLYMWIGATNTGVLLASSLTMAIAVALGHHERWRACRWFLIATAAIGVCFLGLKAYEYYLDWSDQIVPVLHFKAEHFTKVDPAHARLFFVFYFVFTLIHALHLLIGIGVVLSLAWFAGRGKASPNQVEMTGLYWHFVDIVWLYLFPLLYLVA